MKWTQKEEVREPEWEMSIEPLKKVKKRIKRKNIALVFVTVLLVGLIVITGVLTYGQLFHKGASFETVYEGLQCRMIVSEAEILGETDGFSQRVTENLQAIMEEYYPTDLTAAVVGYNRGVTGKVRERMEGLFR